MYHRVGVGSLTLLPQKRKKKEKEKQRNLFYAVRVRTSIFPQSLMAARWPVSRTRNDLP
jgi:hypothetical protein